MNSLHEPLMESSYFTFWKTTDVNHNFLDVKHTTNLYKLFDKGDR